MGIGNQTGEKMGGVVTEFRPVELPAIRAETIEWVNRFGALTYETAIRRGEQWWQPNIHDPCKAAELLAAAETARLRDSELFFVSANMLDLAKVAAESLPDFNLMPSDLPGPAGLVVFERPIEVVNGHEVTASITAATWGPMPNAPDAWPHGGVWISWYADGQRMVRASISDGRYKSMTDLQQRRTKLTVGRLVIHNESPVPYSPEPIAVWDGLKAVDWQDRDDQSILSWVATIKTVWLLMSQRLANVTEHHLDRATRRRLQRAEVDPAPVRVISLRRPSSEATETDSDREYRHRWMVRGHWRMQPCGPERSLIRPTWITPHIKGPEGAPLLGGEKVYALRR